MDALAPSPLPSPLSDLTRDGGTPPGRGEETALAPPPSPPPPRSCVRYVAMLADQPFAIEETGCLFTAFGLIRSLHETRSRRDSEGRIAAPG
jgi:hypothetical protein